MANSLLTINMITREAVELWKNTNSFIRNIDRQYDDQYARGGAKIGSTLRIRLPNDYTVRTGPAASVQDTAEQSTTLTLATQAGVDVSFSTFDRTMSLDDFSERVLAPMVNNVAGYVANTIMNGSEGGICNYVANTDANGNVISPTDSTYLQAGALLTLNSAQNARRKVVNDPITQARVVSSLTGLLNPSEMISRQYATGQMYQALGFEWFEDQTVIKHTGGTFSAGGTVNGAGQTGTSIVVNAITGTLVAGDIITFANVNSVNRITKQTTGQLRQFVVTANVATGGTSIPIYPALIPSSTGVAGGPSVQYQTVDSSPVNAAAMVLVNPASTIYRKNICYAPQAITMATADLVMPEKGVEEAWREAFDGIAMRMLTAYVPGTDQLLTRLDVLFGFLYTRPEWSCIIADSI
jgi:hypothetical protein